MSENGDEKQQGRRRGNSNEKELASQQIQIQSKRFYIDVKENQRGRFIKLAEVGVGGRKSRILMTMSAANEFKNRLADFSEVHSQMGPSHGGATPAAAAVSADTPAPASTAAAEAATTAATPATATATAAATSAAALAAPTSTNNSNNRDNDGLIKSETFMKDRKRYYLDLKENQRGRFLRVSMVVPGPRGARTQIAIPAQGLIEFKDHLNDMLERYGTADDEVPQAELPETKSLRADNKTFYFDCGANQRGTYLKISEVRSNNRYRTSITVPEKYWKQFRDLVSETADKATAAAESSSNEEAVSKPAEVKPAAATTTAATTAPPAVVVPVPTPEKVEPAPTEAK